MSKYRSPATSAEIDRALQIYRPRSFSRKLLVFSFLILAACSGGSGGDEDSPSFTNQTFDFQVQAETDENGRAAVEFALPAQATKFGIGAEPSQGSVRIERISSTDGKTLFSEGSGLISLALIDDPILSYTTVPSRKVDPGLSGKDDTIYRATLVVENGAGAPLPGVTLMLTIRAAADPSFDSGSLPLNIALVGDFAQDPALSSVIAEAIEQMRQIYREQANIVVAVEESASAGGLRISVPADPAQSSQDFYANESALRRSPGVNVFIAGEVCLLAAPDGDCNLAVLGIAGGIPGPHYPSGKSGVAIGLLEHAGPDGVFSPEEVRLLAETIAHEVGHYLGLFHPVEVNGGNVGGTDPLEDTPFCNVTLECLANRSLVSNLMFPSPVEQDDGQLVAQNQLTEDQAAVMNRYVAVD